MRRSKVINMIIQYGFIEISDIIFLLTLSRSRELEMTELYYVECKLGECLRNHDNGSDFFIPLRELKLKMTTSKDKYESGIVEHYLSKKSDFGFLKRLLS